MPGQDRLKLSDEELARRARELFAQVRAEHPEENAGRALDSASEVGGDVLGWVFGGSDGHDADTADAGD
jgi:hypothetical protein